MEKMSFLFSLGVAGFLVDDFGDAHGVDPISELLRWPSLASVLPSSSRLLAVTLLVGLAAPLICGLRLSLCRRAPTLTTSLASTLATAGTLVVGFLGPNSSCQSRELIRETSTCPKHAVSLGCGGRP